MANRRITRKVKSDASRDVDELVPLNNKQREYMKAIEYHNIVLCTGVLGSSKTYIPSVMACDMLLEKQIEHIIVARPNEGKGKSIGYLKGDKNEKLAAWCAPILDVMKKRLGLGNFEALLRNERIEMLALETVKGRSFNDAFVIVDEAEDLDPDIAKSLVTRHGQNCKMVVTGDLAQQDLKSNSGLQFLLNVSKYTDTPIAHIDFDDWEYCVRSEEAKMWGIAFERYEKAESGWK